ncbi:hypothetical protein Gpo141_00001897 [Globisporangium polare]
MERRRTLTIAAVTALLAAAVVVSYAALYGLESSFLSERLVYAHRAMTKGSAAPIAVLRANETLPVDLVAASEPVEISSSNASEVAMMVAEEREQSANVTSGKSELVLATQDSMTDDAASQQQSASPQDDSRVAEVALLKVLADHQKASDSTPAPADNTPPTAQDANLGPASEAPHSVSHDSEIAHVQAEQDVDELDPITAPVEEPEQTKAPESLNDMDELMTPELIRKIESEQIDPLSPIQVHLIWIGDLNNAPEDRFRYTEQGYNLTVHTSAEEILEGFHPFVLKAYRLAIPKVVGYDFLKFALLYKYGGFAADADTKPVVHASEIKFPSDCDVMFGKEAVATDWEKPVYRDQGGPTYGLTRPFQILNWAMVASKPRNKHIEWFLQTAMMHFFGLRDMEYNVVQDISGSGIMTDYVALLHEKAGRSYRDVYLDKIKYVPVEGLCLTDAYLRGKWIHHSFIGTWKNTEEPLNSGGE